MFYTFGVSFFVAYMFTVNDLFGYLPELWLRIADLPLLLMGMIYGGLSLYLSVTHPKKSSRLVGLVIMIPLILIFLFFVILNFWPLFQPSS
jgi:hypothetical protein